MASRKPIARSIDFRRALCRFENKNRWPLSESSRRTSWTNPWRRRGRRFASPLSSRTTLAAIERFDHRAQMRRLARRERDVGPADLDSPPVRQRDRKSLARRLPADRDPAEATALHTHSCAVSIERRDRDPVQLGIGRPVNSLGSNSSAISLISAFVFRAALRFRTSPENHAFPFFSTWDWSYAYNALPLTSLGTTLSLRLFDLDQLP